MFEDVRARYETLEPAGVDRWNPLANDHEFWHRYRLSRCLGESLRALAVPIADARILDVGCGVGRSTRLLLEFGAQPGNILGIDLRPSAVAYARALNPAIPVRVTESLADWPAPGGFDLCLQCTVFSSIREPADRVALAAKMETMVLPGRYLFWWDLRLANDFAGGDPLDPRALFPGCEPVLGGLVPLRPVFTEALKRRLGLPTRLLQRLLGYSPSHCYALLRRVK